ncbi:S-locus glycoprotein domain-containing protein [Artemisia annua]|uniref:S-locus glycoprotein domain-containing protein n=1 Tax=Artemisia annua TaxID=35608 RepID=A0A2U1PB62_ARTAN|nr:S-locus glycoprotein domain-containing protein [Artemisia annua]
MTDVSDADNASAEKEGGTNVKIILIGVFLGIFVISLSTWLWYARRKRHHSQQIEGGSLIGESGSEAMELPLFSFSRVAKATAMFSLDNKLGEGGFGPVYKDPSIDIFTSSSLPLLEHSGVPAEGLQLKIENRGVVPKGGSEVLRMFGTAYFQADNSLVTKKALQQARKIMYNHVVFIRLNEY